ncbi:hypothetical protein EV702DRAFT_1073961 [Suillus placidus]|uniref:Uncharacterized protein n=1 Tax=Suillus placidus TaxID=48579 RepID=A0A9P7A2G5_9AGAM|nr:hypothetical protein EV702DRAFT_1073961 [Suillus placidus]
MTTPSKESRIDRRFALNFTMILSLGSASSNNTRALWDILLSCGWTLFACTWTAVHPNIPGMNEGKVAITSRRLFIMAMALIAPELMITWATRQFFSARAAAKDFNDYLDTQPTKAHSDRRDISGMTATLRSDIPEGGGRPRAPKHTKFRRMTMALFPWMGGSRAVTEFKGWTITHGFFAWMGGFMLCVDDEPRATLTPDNLLHFVDEGSVDMPVISQVEVEDRSKGDGLSKGIAILQLAWFVVQLFARYVQNLPITLLEIDTLAIAALTCISYGLWWKKPKDVGCPCIVHWKGTANQLNRLTYNKADLGRLRGGRLRGLIYPFISLMGLEALISHRAASSRRVPSLGGYGKYHARIVILIGCSSGIVFGGIHCLGWNYLFQTYTQHMLWRAASLGIACAPVLLFLDLEYGMSLGRNVSKYRYFIITVATVSSLIYISSRVALIVLMMLSFRSLPLGVYDTVVWTQFIPHL